MARAAFWKGYLKLSLVTCPVTMTPATTEGEKVRFHTLNKETGRRVKTRYVDSETGKPVKEDDEVKGYETSDGQFVTFEDEELEAVALESVRTIDIDTFVKKDTINWIYYDSPYYVAPDDKVGEEAFAVIREAMASKGVVGISRVVLFRRERAVMLEPRGNGIVLWTLRYGNEVRDPADYFSTIDDEKAEPKLLKMITTLIDERSESWSPSMVQDPVQTQLKAIIAEKRKKSGKAKKKPDEEQDGRGASNVVDLMGALKKSLEKSEKKPSRK
ncbi:Ku protein [Aquamicrobium sp. LC103]|uniref:non-homologous end joining protein Ku n=1 Tax=Aquamicrobium sp. LC103 TaxID=1120658 RepID=UPI00063E95CB|nr:Ku protein [Aquamicrobium sp. LC103]TKT74771.1 Ku protein [Aquamicrobium sp. LC103]